MIADVVVVGAGLAGQRCAVALSELGREVMVLEARDVVGGRVRTDVVDGFLCDRGFQLLNPAYPAVRRWVDPDAVALQSFGAAVMVRGGDALRVVADPLREPRLLRQMLRSGGDPVSSRRWAAGVPGSCLTRVLSSALPTRHRRSPWMRQVSSVAYGRRSWTLT